MRMRPLRAGIVVCSATGGALGTLSQAKRWAASSCSAGSSLTLIIARAEVPISNWLGVTAPTGAYQGQAHCFWRTCT
jgi:hypothetical protein